MNKLIIRNKFWSYAVNNRLSMIIMGIDQQILMKK